MTLPRTSPIDCLPETECSLCCPPALFADGSDWAQMRARLSTDPVLERLASLICRRSEKHLAAPLVAHRMEGIRRLSDARQFQGRILDLATVACLFGDTTASERAKEEMLALTELPDWGTRHFLDVAEYALGLATGFSWLRDSLTQDEKGRMAQALIDKALRPSFESDATFLRWLGGKNNWTQVCHAGLVAAALSVHDRVPELAQRTIRRAIADQAGPAEAYAPDGAYTEGPIYWAYGTLFHVILLCLLEKAHGRDYGLADFPGFLESADYIARMITPTGRFFNYADSRERVPSMPVLHWFAARRGCPGLAAFEVRRLVEADSGDEPPYETERLEALALWWRVAQPDDARPLPSKCSWQGETPVAVARTGCGAPTDAFLGIKGGRASSPHAHFDAGSFVYEFGGVRWAVDLGMQDYHSLESAGIQLWDGSQTGERWTVFRLGQESHNLLRFDDRLGDVNAAATLHETAEGFELDLSPIHAPGLKCVTRHAQLRPNGSLCIHDRWQSGPTPAVARWQWLTEADIATTPEGALLRQDGRTLLLHVVSPSRGTWSLTIEPAEALLGSADAPCPGVKRLTIHVPCPAKSAGEIRVEANLLTDNAN